MAAAYPPIPYGRSAFPSIRRDGCLYVDKTRFLRELEKERYVFFIRPRRFGKSLWLAMLECYYDRTQKDAFDALFADTAIGREPTVNRSRYLVVYFDFSAFSHKPETLEQRFEEYCFRQLRDALRRNPDLFDDEATRDILGHPSIGGKLDELFLRNRERGVPVYVMVDEYDNFANTILAHEGDEAYQSLTHGSGFYRSFFAALKAGTSRAGSIERLFVTGVSPVTMDDVTSGFNIGTNVSLEARFNEMLGFTDDEVRRVLATYHRLGALRENPDEALAIMREWYNGYRFAQEAERDVYNTDMVLHYLRYSLANKRRPNELIDNNIRIDYGKLRHLLVVSRQARQPELNGNFDLLRHVVAEERANSRIHGSFPLERLAERENFLSLLHFFGLLSIRGAARGMPVLGIPNQTVKHLLYGFLRDAYRDAGLFAVDFYELEGMLRDMAYDGAWHPVIEFLAGAIARHTGIRDYIAGEKVLQGFLAAYLCLADCFVFHSEKELNGGYADICLEPHLASYPDMGHGYVVELKYLKQNEGSESRIDAAANEAVRQLRQYLADPALARQFPTVRFTGLVLVFHGSELVRSEAVAVGAIEGQHGSTDRAAHSQ